VRPIARPVTRPADSLQQDSIAETQLRHDASASENEADNHNLHAGQDEQENSDEDGDCQSFKPRKSIPITTTTKDQAGVKEKLGKAVKKISSTAHANFRRLKIKSKGVGGGSGGAGGGFKGRFGRRR